MTKGNPQTFDNIDVQQSLMELEREMDRGQSSTASTPDNQRKTSLNNANNLNNSNAVCVHVTANSSEPVAVTVITQSGPQVKGLPPPNLNTKGEGGGGGGTQLQGAQNKRTTSIISTSKQRGVSPSRESNGKRVQFKEDLEENIPIHSSITPPPSPQSTARPILSNTSQGYQPSYSPRIGHGHPFNQPHNTTRPLSFPNTESTHYGVPQHTRSHSVSGVQPMSPPITRSTPSPHNIQLIDAHPIPHAISHQVALGHHQHKSGSHHKSHSPGSPVMRINANAATSPPMSRNQSHSQQQPHSPVTLINANAMSKKVGSPKIKHDTSPPVYHVISPSLMPKSHHKPQAIVQPQTQAGSPHGYREPSANIYASSPVQQQSPSSHQPSHMYSPPQQSSPRSSPYPLHPSRSSPVDIITSPQRSQHISNGSPMSPPTSSTFMNELNNALKPKPGAMINNNNLSSKPPPSPRNRVTRQDIPYSQSGQSPYGQGSPYNQGSQSPRQAHPPRVMYPVDGPTVPKQGIQSPPQSPGGVNAIRVLPQSPGVTLRSTGHPNAQLTRQTSNKGPKPPPPPRRTDSGSLAGKKVPPPPPQRTT